MPSNMCYDIRPFIGLLKHDAFIVPPVKILFFIKNENSIILASKENLTFLLQPPSDGGTCGTASYGTWTIVHPSGSG